MKMKKTLAVMTAMAVTLSLPMTTMAATWEGVDDYDKLSTAFGDTETEVHIILSGNITNDNYETLVANEGQTYTIDGKEYTLTDVSIGGGGDVTINADIQGSELEDADAALNTTDDVSVTVNGDISAVNAGVDADGNSKVVVNGEITSEIGAGVGADDNANVTVNGDIYGGAGADGVDASDDTTVVVNGNVYGGDGTAPDEDGNLDNGTMSDPFGYSDGGAGVKADGNANVNVDGNVYGGDSYGTYSYAGAGIDVMDKATVSVTGDAVGGDQIADPDVPAEAIDENGDAYSTEGCAGDGVYMDNTADVTVGGDAIGGTASGQDAWSGSGVYIKLTLTSEGERNPETGEYESQKINPGQVTVKGTIISGESTGEGGKNIGSVFFAYDGDKNPLEDFLLPNDFIERVSSNEDTDYVCYSIYETTARLTYGVAVNYIDHETRLLYREIYTLAVTELAAEYGVDTENITDFKEVVKAVPEDKLSEFASKAMYIYNDIASDMALQTFAFPQVTTSGMEASGNAGLVESNIEELVKYGEIKYIKFVGPETEESEPETEESEPETEESEPETSKRPSSDKRDDEATESPKTGDTSIIYVMGTVLVVSAIILFGVTVTMARKRK